MRVLPEAFLLSFHPSYNADAKVILVAGRKSGGFGV